jgi:hypothetical protein
MITAIEQIATLTVGSPVIYVITLGDTYVKIGATTDLPKRLQEFCANNPHKLVLHSLFHNDESVEQALHTMFGHVHHKNEWFLYDAKLLRKLNRKPINLPLELAYRITWRKYPLIPVTPPKPLREELERLLSEYEPDTITTNELKEKLIPYTGKVTTHTIKKAMVELGWKALNGRYAKNGWVAPMQRWGAQAW